MSLTTMSNKFLNRLRWTSRKSLPTRPFLVERLEDRTLLTAPVILGSLSLGGRGGVGQIAVNPTTDNIYLASGFGPGQLQVVNASNPANPTLVTTTSAQGWGAAVNPLTNRYFTGDGYSGDILVYDGITNASCRFPAARELRRGKAGCREKHAGAGRGDPWLRSDASSGSATATWPRVVLDRCWYPRCLSRLLGGYIFIVRRRRAVSR